MTPDIKKRIEDAREEIGRVVKKCSDDIKEMLRDKVIVFSDRAYISYLFPDKVNGSPCDDGEEYNDFEVYGYILSLNFEPIPAIKVSYGCINLEHPNIDPGTQIRDWGNEIENEILDLIEKRLVGKDLKSEEDVAVWVEEKGGIYKKDSIYLLSAPAYLFGRTRLIHCAKGKGVEEREKVHGPKEGRVKICDIWTMIKTLIGVY